MCASDQCVIGFLSAEHLANQLLGRLQIVLREECLALELRVGYLSALAVEGRYAVCDRVGAHGHYRRTDLLRRVGNARRIELSGLLFVGDLLGEVFDAGDLLGRIDGRTEVTDSQPVRFGLDTQVLRRQQRIGHPVEKPGEIIVARLGIALFAPHRKTVDIGTNRNHAGSLRNHRLIEMTRGQCLAQFPALSNDQTVKLHIAARRGTRGGFEHVLQHLRRNRLRAEFSDRTVFCKQCFHTDYKLRNKFTQK